MGKTEQKRGGLILIHPHDQKHHLVSVSSCFNQIMEVTTIPLQTAGPNQGAAGHTKRQLVGLSSTLYFFIETEIMIQLVC